MDEIIHKKIYQILEIKRKNSVIMYLFPFILLNLYFTPLMQIIKHRAVSHNIVFVDESIVAYQSHRLHVTPVQPFLNPYNRKARCSAERGDISHSSYSWPLALSEILFMNKRHTSCVQSQVANMQFYSYLSRAYCN